MVMRSAGLPVGDCGHALYFNPALGPDAGVVDQVAEQFVQVLRFARKVGQIGGRVKMQRQVFVGMYMAHGAQQTLHGGRERAALPRRACGCGA